MHLGLTALLEFYYTHRNDKALVLGTVSATEGSTYRKPGAMMLIATDGSYQGLISGGCLEADLASRANEVFAKGKTQDVCYDMSRGDDFAWGLGLGCEGSIQLLLQRLNRSDDFGFLETLRQAWQQRRGGMLCLVTSSTDSTYQAGCFWLDCGPSLSRSVPESLSHLKVSTKSLLSEPQDRSRRFQQDSIDTANGQLKVILIPVLPPPAILICGAGHDAVPVARLAAEMGWDCTVVDHRPGFARAKRFPDSCEVRLLQPEDLSAQVPLEAYDAAILMTHHLGHDRKYLSQVVKVGIAYIGLLGPRARRDRLLKEIDALDVHVHGPAGLNIGAEMPESIALAIIAEIHAFLNQCDGSMLTRSDV